MGIYAWVKAIAEPVFCSDPDLRGYYSQEDADEPTWRVKLEILDNMLRRPVLAEFSPNEPRFRYVHRPLQRSTLPLEESALRYILSLSGSDLEKKKRLADTVEGIKYLETDFERSAPEVRQKISRYIERGRIGQRLKLMRRGRCQICEVLGKNEVAFLDRHGRAFSEPHHVIPVSSGVNRSSKRIKYYGIVPESSSASALQQL